MSGDIFDSLDQLARDPEDQRLASKRLEPPPRMQWGMIRHANNVATTGRTCITGVFNYADIRWLHHMCPHGSRFSPTFFESINVPELGDELWPWMWRRYQNKGQPFYFHFLHQKRQEDRFYDVPDDQGLILLITLQLNGVHINWEQLT